MKKFLKEYGQIVSISIVLLGSVFTFAKIQTSSNCKMDELEIKTEIHRGNINQNRVDIHSNKSNISNINGKLDIILDIVKNLKDRERND